MSHAAPSGGGPGLAGRLVVRREDFDLDVALSLAAGEVVAVVGPNGAGKSTLLRMISGLEVPGAVTASVVVNGEDWSSRPPERRRVGLAFQDLRLFPHLDVLDNVAFPLRARGRSRQEACRRAEQELARVGVPGSLHGRRPDTLSGGEAQRVALARAVVADPEVLLLDEPFAAVDAEFRGLARAALVDRLATFPGTTLVVTHDPTDALLLGHRVLVLERGRVTQYATPHEVARRPASSFAAELVGTNLLPAHVEAGEVTTAKGTRVVVADDVADGPVALVVPPSAVALHRELPSGTPRNVWEADVVAIELVGGRARIVLLVAGVDELVAEVTLSAVDALGITTGQRLWASVKATEIAVIADNDTGIRGGTPDRS